MRFSFVVVLILIAGVLASCAPEFSPYWRVDKLRVLAIKADPAVAMPMEPVTLSALVYSPEEAVSYRWSWCPVRTSAQDNFECALEGEEIEGFPTDFSLGEEETATFLNPFSAEQVREFCEAITRLIIEEFDDPELAGLLPGGDCERGYEISVRLEVTTSSQSLVAGKRLVLWGGSEQFNENPRIDALQVRPEDPADLARLRRDAGWELAGDTDHDDQWVIISEETTVQTVPGIALEVRALVDPESLQTYRPSPPRGQESRQMEPVEEALVFRYFTTAGSIGSRRLFSPEHHELEEAPITNLRLSAEAVAEQCTESTDEGCLVRLWSVARDNRLGVDWIEGRLLVLE